MVVFPQERVQDKNKTMQLTQRFNDYKVEEESNKGVNGLYSGSTLESTLDSLLSDIPNFSVLKQRISNFNPGQNHQIHKRVQKIAGFIKKDKNKVALFEKILDNDCVGIIVGKLDKIVGILEGRGINSALATAKEDMLRDIITCFVNTPALREVYQYGTEKKHWFVAHHSVQNYDSRALFNLPFNMDRGEPHFVNTFVNQLASVYALPLVSRDVDHHTIEMKGVDGSPLSYRIFATYKRQVERYVVMRQNAPIEVRNIGGLLDTMVAQLKAAKTSQYSCTAEYAGEVYGLHRYYGTKLNRTHNDEDVKAAVLLHLIPYMAQSYVSATIKQESIAQMWLASSATLLQDSLPSDPNDEGYAKLNKILSTTPVTVDLSKFLSGDLKKRFEESFQVDDQGGFLVEGKHFVECNEEDYLVHYKASRHTLLTIMAGMVASQKGLVDLTPKNICAQVAFLVWQQDPDQNIDLLDQASQSWGLVSCEEQQVRIKQVKERHSEPKLAHLSQPAQRKLSLRSQGESTNTSASSILSGLFSGGAFNISSGTRMDGGATKSYYGAHDNRFDSSDGGKRSPGLAAMLDALAKRPSSYSVSEVQGSAIKKDFKGLESEKKLLNILELARLNPHPQDFPLNSNGPLGRYLIQHKNFLATYCVLVLADCKGKAGQERWLRRFFEETQQVIIAKPADKSIDQRVDRFFAQAANSKKFADALSRPLSPQVYKANGHFFSMGFDSFKKIATAVNNVKMQRSKEGVWPRVMRLLMWFWYLITFRRPVHEVIRTYGFFNQNKRAQEFYRNYKGLRPC